MKKSKIISLIMSTVFFLTSVPNVLLVRAATDHTVGNISQWTNAITNLADGDTIKITSDISGLPLTSVNKNNVTIKSTNETKYELTFNVQNTTGYGISSTGKDFSIEGLSLKVEGTNGPSVLLLKGENATVKNNIIEVPRSNSSNQGGAGIMYTRSGSTNNNLVTGSYTITGNEFIGSDDTTDLSGRAFYAENEKGSLGTKVFSENTITGNYFHPIGIKTGNVTVENNIFDFNVFNQYSSERYMLQFYSNSLETNGVYLKGPITVKGNLFRRTLNPAPAIIYIGSTDGANVAVEDNVFDSPKGTFGIFSVKIEKAKGTSIPNLLVNASTNINAFSKKISIGGTAANIYHDQVFSFIPKLFDTNEIDNLDYSSLSLTDLSNVTKAYSKLDLNKGTIYIKDLGTYKVKFMHTDGSTDIPVKDEELIIDGNSLIVTQKFIADPDFDVVVELLDCSDAVMSPAKVILDDNLSTPTDIKSKKIKNGTYKVEFQDAANNSIPVKEVGDMVTINYSFADSLLTNLVSPTKFHANYENLILIELEKNGSIIPASDYTVTIEEVAPNQQIVISNLKGNDPTLINTKFDYGKYQITFRDLLGDPILVSGSSVVDLCFSTKLATPHKIKFDVSNNINTRALDIQLLKDDGSTTSPMNIQSDVNYKVFDNSTGQELVASPTDFYGEVGKTYNFEFYDKTTNKKLNTSPTQYLVTTSNINLPFYFTYTVESKNLVLDVTNLSGSSYDLSKLKVNVTDSKNATSTYSGNNLSSLKLLEGYNYIISLTDDAGNPLTLKLKPTMPINIPVDTSTNVTLKYIVDDTKYNLVVEFYNFDGTAKHTSKIDVYLGTKLVYSGASSSVHNLVLEPNAYRLVWTDTVNGVQSHNFVVSKNETIKLFDSQTTTPVKKYDIAFNIFAANKVTPATKEIFVNHNGTTTKLSGASSYNIILEDGTYSYSWVGSNGITYTSNFIVNGNDLIINIIDVINTGGGSTGGGSSSGSGSGSGGGSGIVVKAPETKTDETTEIKETETPKGSVKEFSDVDKGDWFYEAIMTLAENNIITGYSDNTFKPNNKITRSEFAVLITKLFDLKLKDSDKKFSDIKDGEWYSEYIDIVSSNDIFAGYDDGTFKPDKFITREEISAVILRLINYKNLEFKVIRDGDVKDAKDVSDYAKVSVAKLYSMGIINGYEDGSFKPKNQITRAEASQILYILFNEINK